jgi:hypothetical protein
MDEYMPIDERPDRRSDRFDHLIDLVGDADALTRLDREPLPDEAFDWSSVEPGDRPFVSEVIALADRYCEEMLDTEYRTITRRLLARAAARDPRVLRRSTNMQRLAAGLVWLAGRANGEFGRRGRRTGHRLWDWFGVADCSDRGRGLRKAAGLETGSVDLFGRPDAISLGDPALLHSRFRGDLIAQRDAILSFASSQRRWSLRDDGRTADVSAEPIRIFAVTKGLIGESGRVAMVVAYGDNLEDARFFALSVPDARDLGSKLSRALDQPIRLPSP